ncbi:MAG: hypothetical protein HUU15_00940 [Candidatus Brocadiae bacterium]|nr:hypothetical protein [Candidatus Brocadiia bacterium]
MNRFFCSAAVALLLCIPAFARRAADPEKDRKVAEPGAPGKPSPNPRDESMENELADRVAPEDLLPQVSLLPVHPADGALALRGKGFVVLSRKDGQVTFESRNADGSAGETLFAPGHPVSRWWLSPDGGRLVWRSGDSLFTAVPGSKTMDSLDLAPDGDVAFQADGSQAAWVVGGQVVLKRFGDRGTVTITPEKGHFLGNTVALSADGRSLYALVSPDGAAEPDGLAACDLSKDGRVLTRIFTASSACLKTLAVSPDGTSLLFVQTALGKKQEDSLRLFFPASGDVKTLTRAPEIADATFAAGLDRIAFTAKGANGRWQAWGVPTTADSSKGLFLAERIAELEGYEFRKPAYARDGALWMLLSKDAGTTWTVGTTAPR